MSVSNVDPAIPLQGSLHTRVDRLLHQPPLAGHEGCNLQVRLEIFSRTDLMASVLLEKSYASWRKKGDISWGSRRS